MELTAQVCTGWLIVADVLARYGWLMSMIKSASFLQQRKHRPNLRFIYLSYVL
jgi:hypothetical protein